jgi:hypothetical protein
MRVACWLAKATDTHPESVIIIIIIIIIIICHNTIFFKLREAENLWACHEYLKWE